MSDLRTMLPNTESALLSQSGRIAPEDPKQRNLMVGSLFLLLLALGIVLWHDRDFWFPDAPEAESDQPIGGSGFDNVVAPHPAVVKSILPMKPKRQVTSRSENAVASVAEPSAPVPPVFISARTVLPPLEVEVVAGDTLRTIRPGSNAVHVELQPGIPAPSVGEGGPSVTPETAANVTSNAAERVEMSTDTSAIVTKPVKPSYPLLARQMKVQGSVILQALIGKDGTIQNLRLVSGPRILASAAEDAVRQWHFKPHLQGSDAVETQAQITVNFTISTN